MVNRKRLRWRRDLETQAEACATAEREIGKAGAGFRKSQSREVSDRVAVLEPGISGAAVGVRRDYDQCLLRSAQGNSARLAASRVRPHRPRVLQTLHRQ